ncbi:hypothetical protein N9D38_11265 [Rubripirellula sp.]|nr:hypothetical protein [Rubripirellula sp.]
MLNLREMAQTNCWIRKLDETKKLPKQPYCVGCENKVDDWDVYVDMRDEYASTHATCPHCGLINYEDSKDIHPAVAVLVFFIGIPAVVWSVLMGFGIDEENYGVLGVTAYGISFLFFYLIMNFRVSDLKKRMEEIEERR